MISDERKTRQERVALATQAMMTAARTAPKSRGIDIIEIITVTNPEKEQLVNTMLEMGLNRDGENTRIAEAVVIIGTPKSPLALNCGYCGCDTCEQNKGKSPCEMNSVDLGIAIGSACAMAVDCRVDTRVMLSVGRAAKKMGLLPTRNEVYGIVVSCSSKSPFFGRK